MNQALMLDFVKVLAGFFPTACALRLGLVDKGMLCRERDGSHTWRAA
ncbi:MAG: hypothetical protein ABSB41_15485 [Anaerolineales bacterium]|jgi:hypothetical protein